MKKHLLLLHGALGHPEQFSDITPELGLHFVIHTPLFYGHGGMNTPEEDLTISSYVSQLKNYCQEHKIDRCLIFGYSMGGYVALVFSSLYPEKVDAVLTLATKLNWTPENSLKESKMLDAQTIAEKVPQFARKLSSLHGEDSWVSLTQQLSNLILHLGHHPQLTAEMLSHIPVKTQLMVGDTDKMVGISETHNAYMALPNASFSVLPDTGHPFEKVDPVLLITLMKKFFLQKM